MTKLSSWEYLGKIPNKPSAGVFGTSVIGERDTWIDLAPESEAATKWLSISQHQRCSGLSRASGRNGFPGCLTMFHWECGDATGNDMVASSTASPGCRWVCLKMLCTPKNPMVLLIIISTKWLFHWGIPHFQTYPDWCSAKVSFQHPKHPKQCWVISPLQCYSPGEQS